MCFAGFFFYPAPLAASRAQRSQAFAAGVPRAGGPLHVKAPQKASWGPSVRGAAAGGPLGGRVPVAPHHVLQVQRRHAEAGRGSGLRRLQPPGNGAATAASGRPRGGDLRRPPPCAAPLAPPEPPGSAQPAEAAGLGSILARWRRRAERGGCGELEVPGECMLPGRRALGGCCGDCLACRPRPPRQGLRDLAGVCFAGEGSSAAPVRVRRAASEPGLSGDLGQGETLRAAVHLLVQC